MRIERKLIQRYGAYLKDKHRPPSRGGNTRAWHLHVLTIDDKTYSFLALGARKWAFLRDVVTFDWNWDESRSYRNVDRDSFKAFRPTGEFVRRGIRGDKPWRIAETRLPARRKEWKD
jgi:hypothetical protein